MWNQVANHYMLWKTVRMKNSLVTNWKGLARALQLNNSRHLDLKKMLIASDANEMWKQFSENIGTVINLKSIDFCRCPSWVIEKLCASNQGLEVLNALTINQNEINISQMGKMRELRELRLRSTDCMNVVPNFQPLKELIHLKHVSLTSVTDLGKMDVSIFGELVELESLELGECSDLSDIFARNALSKLINLEKLRLEKCQHNCAISDILQTVSALPKLSQLELINVDVAVNFAELISNCVHLRRLLLIPT